MSLGWGRCVFSKVLDVRRWHLPQDAGATGHTVCPPPSLLSVSCLSQPSPAPGEAVEFTSAFQGCGCWGPSVKVGRLPGALSPTCGISKYQVVTGGWMRILRERILQETKRVIQQQLDLISTKHRIYAVWPFAIFYRWGYLDFRVMVMETTAGPGIAFSRKTWVTHFKLTFFFC